MKICEFHIWSGARACQSCRSRKMLQDGALQRWCFAKIGFDTIENEPTPLSPRQINSSGRTGTPDAKRSRCIIRASRAATQSGKSAPTRAGVYGISADIA